jgi:type VI secretion system ImpC/EvpB family protein
MTPQSVSNFRNEVLTEDAKAPGTRDATSKAAPTAPSQPQTLLDLVLHVTKLDPNEARATVDEYLPGLKPWLKSPLSAIREEAVSQIEALESDVRAQTERITRHHAFQLLETVWNSLRYWVDCVGPLDGPVKKDHLKQALGRDIAQIDNLLNRQVNGILHHADFQKLEASWRGLDYLVKQTEGTENIQIRVLSLTRSELNRDLTRASEFDQSQLFRKVYSEEFDTPGGTPYGVLIGDLEFKNHPDDLEVLGKISGVAAAAFAPFIAAASPNLFGVDTYADLDRPFNLSGVFDQTDYLKWRAFRDSEDSRFVGLTLPHMLMREPYKESNTRVDGFQFEEEVDGPDVSKYLWGNAAYAFGGVLIRAFADSSWLADIRGVPWRDESGRIRRGVLGGGLITDLPVHSFRTDRDRVAPKFSTETVITDAQEKELGDIGFIPLCRCKDTTYSVFYGNQSAQKPQKYDRAPATINAKLSAMMQYTLCVSRFAHYLKVLGRDKIGSTAEAGEMQDFLHRWVQQYVTGDDNASIEVKAEYPLREAKVQVSAIPGKPGNYMCVMHLRPHFQLDELTAAVKLKTELAPPRAS